MVVKKSEKRELSQLEHRMFLIFLGMVFLLSVFTILSLVNSDNLTGHAAAQNIAYMKGGSDLFFEIRNVEGMQSADIKLIETVKEGQIVFDDAWPTEFDGRVFNSFKVSSEDSAKLGEVTYILKIRTAELLPVGINLNDLKLYVNNKEADTVKTSAQGDYTFYRAKLDKFEEGDYVIGLAAAKKAGIEKIDEPVEQPSEPAKEKVEESVEEEIKEESEESRGALVGEAIQPSESKQGFFSKIADFFRKLFG